MDTELTLMQGMTENQRLLFQGEMARLRKSSTVGVTLALFLGGLGAHRFYMGQVGLGVLYILFCWTLIPALLGLIEAFVMPERVRLHNEAQAQQVAAKLRLLGDTSAPSRS